MAIKFNYKAVGDGGKIQTGILEAENKSDLIQILRSRGQRPIKVEEKVTINESALSKDVEIFPKKVKTKDIVIFCRQLYTMLNAGMPLVTALDVLIDQSENIKLKKAIAGMYDDVRTGEMLSKAMEKHTKVFPELLINMVEAGEMTGKLDDVLNKMAVHYDKENKINSQIKGAMIYPIVLTCVATFAVTFLLVFVMPNIVGMFTGSGVELPLPTRIVMGIGDAVRKYWYIFVIGIVAIVYGLKKILQTYKGKKAKDKFILKIPGVKVSVQKIFTSRFTRTLSTLLASGIPILDAIESSASVTGNTLVIEGMKDVSDDIKKGESLSVLLRKLDLFPKMMVSMISIGEESGSLEEMLSKTADYYDDELEASLKKLVALIEPLAILVMGVLIGMIVIAMMLPMFDMVKTVG
ncbi:MAG: type II secretion system F family protein [Clostridiales bacterium]|nr:type II secretion system F family protein [Clostridiales bacterium]